jgi:hypothetical protein
MQALEDVLVALNDLATGPPCWRSTLLHATRQKEPVISRSNKGAPIESAQSSADDVLDTKQFCR